MENVEEKLARAISESFKQYKEKGARSPEKLKPLHKFIADLLTEVWGKEFSVSFMGEKTKEMNVKGKYYPKDFARLFNAKLSFSNFISELEAYRDFAR